jgi:hypothetical protein
MRSLEIIAVHELRKLLGDGGPTADQRVMEAVNPHLDYVKPLFDEVSVDVVQMTARV